MQRLGPVILGLTPRSELSDRTYMSNAIHLDQGKLFSLMIPSIYNHQTSSIISPLEITIAQYASRSFLGTRLCCTRFCTRYVFTALYPVCYRDTNVFS